MLQIECPGAEHVTRRGFFGGEAHIVRPENPERRWSHKGIIFSIAATSRVCRTVVSCVRLCRWFNVLRYELQDPAVYRPGKQPPEARMTSARRLQSGGLWIGRGESDQVQRP